MITTLLSWFGGALFKWAIVAVVIAGAIGTVYVKGRIDQANVDRIEQLEEINRKLREREAIREKAAKEDAEQSQKDAAELADLEAKIEKLTNELKDADRQCLDADDTDGVQDLWD